MTEPTNTPPLFPTSEAYFYESCETDATTRTNIPTFAEPQPIIENNNAETTSGFYTASLGLLSLTQGCTSQPSAIDVASKRGRHMVGAITEMPASLISPLTSTDLEFEVLGVTDLENLNLVFENDAAVFHPALFESFSWNEDRTQFTVKIRDDITWSDGTLVTTKDYQFAWSILGDPTASSINSDSLDGTIPGKFPEILIDETTGEPSSNTMVFHYLNSGDTMIRTLEISRITPVPAHVLQNYVEKETSQYLKGHPFNSDPEIYTNTGRFLLENYEPDVRMHFTMNGESPFANLSPLAISELTYLIVPNSETRRTMLEAGEIDFLETSNTSDLDVFRQSPDFKIVKLKNTNFEYLAFNAFDAKSYKAAEELALKTYQTEIDRIEAEITDPIEKARALDSARSLQRVDTSQVAPHPILGDDPNTPENEALLLRQAFVQAINIEDMTQKIFSSENSDEVYAQKAQGFVQPHFPGIYDENSFAYEFNPGAAKNQLAELGWTDSNGDGILDKNGVDLEFTILVSSSSPVRKKVAILIQSYLKDIGVQVHIEKIQGSSVYRRTKDRDFDAMLGGTGYVEALGDTANRFYSGSLTNYGNYSNPEVDALLDQAERAANYEDQMAIWRQINDITYRDQAYTPLFFKDTTFIINNRIENVSITPNTREFHRWTLDPNYLPQEKETK